MKIDKFNMSAKKLGEIEVSDSVFGVEFNGPLVHQEWWRSWPTKGRAQRAPSRAVKFAAEARSLGGRRAPAGQDRDPYALLNGRAAA